MTATLQPSREQHLALVAQLREKMAAAALGGSAKSRERHVGRGKLLPRDRVDGLLDPGSPLLEISRPGRRRHVRRRVPRRGHDRRHRTGVGARVHDRRQRRDGQRRHVLPDYGQEASARPGDRAAEPAAVHLPGRLRRRVPAAAGRGVPRPGPFRPHLLQPGDDERRRALRRSPPCSAPAPQAVPMCPR